MFTKKFIQILTNRESLKNFLVVLNKMIKNQYSLLLMLDLNVFFYIFSVFLLVFACMVVISQHPVFSLLFLVSCFIFSAFLLFILECEFLALLFIIIYVGAIAVLFLFAVMMLESKLQNLKQNSIKYIPISLIFIYVFFLSLEMFDCFIDLSSGIFNLNKYHDWYRIMDFVTDVEVYGQVLYSYFVLQLLIAGLILLLALIGVVYLTSSSKKLYKEQSDFKQLSRTLVYF